MGERIQEEINQMIRNDEMNEEYFVQPVAKLIPDSVADPVEVFALNA
jgi:hypothetical protein